MNSACPIEFPSWVSGNHSSNTPRWSFSSLTEKVSLYSNLCLLGMFLSLLGIQWHLQPHCTEAQSLLHLSCHPLEGITWASHQPFICHLHPALGSCLPAGWQALFSVTRERPLFHLDLTPAGEPEVCRSLASSGTRWSKSRHQTLQLQVRGSWTEEKKCSECYV